MYKIFRLLLIAGFLVMGCIVSKVEALDVYTFKKDRVDQKLEGNRGYIMGKPKHIPENKRKAQRTIIGIDVEVPTDVRITDAAFNQWGKGSEEVQKTEPKAIPSKTKIRAKVIEVKKEETVEDEWIK